VSALAGRACLLLLLLAGLKVMRPRRVHESTLLPARLHPEAGAVHCPLPIAHCRPLLLFVLLFGQRAAPPRPYRSL
jgi:hypothetical protein